MYRTLLPLLALLLVFCAPAIAQDNYQLGPDSMPQAGVPRGETTRYTIKSRIFPGTVRDYTVYVPKQYDASKPARVMFFQDGGGGLNVPTVFDNLIAKKEMPVTVAIMIPPGVVPASGPKALPRFNRSHEYDGMSEAYARFLVEEVLPQVGAKLNLSKDPNDRGLCGASSGGIAAFTAAWQRPDQFRRVISFVGSFTDLQGGNLYNSLIRKMEPKPLRVFLQDGSNDQDIYSGSWPNGNKDVYDALKYSGYDVKFVLGTGPHSGRHGASILPDVLRWIWRDYPAPIAQPSSGRWPLNEAWIPGENWQPVAGVAGPIGGLAGDTDGSVWVSLPRENRIVSIGANGELDPRRTILGVRAPAGLTVGPDGALVVCEPQNRRIVRVATGLVQGSDRARIEPMVRDVVCSHLVANHAGDIYFTDDRDGKIYFQPAKGKRRLASADVPAASALTLTPDQSLLLVTQARQSKWGYSLVAHADGGLTDCQDYFDLVVPYGEPTSGASSLATDTNGWLYVASKSGIQMLDQAGRVNGILANPIAQAAPAGSEHLAFGGPDRNTLYAVQGGALYRRKVKARGVLPSEAPIKPPAPRL
ncbi:MAG TPA: alpha/beta hydrolase-fold protein [Chthonomonadaceae bacterium]|nr:alpha/beta hydrolase-fold protein [Chthonomonadaceae bacterium]